MRLIPALAATFLLAGLGTSGAHAQDHGRHHGGAEAVPGASSQPAPYSGMQTRRVKALSQEQIDALRAGSGMGLALAAELNGYPGPKHVLELADALALTADQRAKATALFDAMKAEVIPLGERIIAEETALDGLFAERRVTAETLGAATARIAAAQGALRAAHLRYHLMMPEILSADQVALYHQRRGYAAGHGGHAQH